MELSDLVYIDLTGYHYADYPTFLQYFTDKYKGIYGVDTYLGPETQDAQNIAVTAKAAYDSAVNGAATYSSFSPKTAKGTGLSRVVKINGIERQLPSKSTAVLTIIGVAGTVLNNCIAIDSIGQKWVIPDATTIPGPGTIDVTATNQVDGALNAVASSINIIFTPTLGWQSVNNVDAATPGSAVESDAELRIRQTESTALPSQTVFDGTLGAVANVTGVTKVANGYENDTNSTNGDGIPAHSIAVVVAGGDSTEIAQAILDHKTPGCYTFGSTSKVVYDSKGMPSTIRFTRPTPATISAQLTLSTNEGWTNDYIPLIQQAFADAIDLIGIGDIIVFTKLFIPCYLIGTPAFGTFDIVTLEIQKNSDGFDTINIDLDWDEEAVCDPDTDVDVTP